MSITTTEQTQAAEQSFNRAVNDLKHGVASATGSYAHVSDTASKAGADLVEFSKGTLEAVAQASQVFAAGSQELFRDMTASYQEAFKEGFAAFRAIALAKTVRERLELQTTFVRTSAVQAINESSRFARAGLDLAEKASAPLAARAYVAADKFATIKA